MPRFDAAALDDVIHGRLRLGLMAYLASVSEATFGELKVRTGATDGNLSANLRKLEEAGYVAIEKRFVGRKPQTRASMTRSGRVAWLAYLDQLQSLVESSRSPASDA